MPTNLKEIGFEKYFTDYLVEQNGFIFKDFNHVHQGHYSIKECVDTVALFQFLESSQPVEMGKLKRNYGDDYQVKFLARLQKEIKEKGVLKLLRTGIKDLDTNFKLMYFEPVSKLNPDLQNNWEQNIFVVSRQVHYSSSNNNSLDMVIFVNGLPIITLELKNLLTGQSYRNAIFQYKNDRSSREELFKPDRCLVHFAMDTEEVYMTTVLSDEKTWFLPFNKGNNGGAGNPIGKDGVRVKYMWEEILTKSSLSTLIQNYVQKIETTDKKGKVKIQRIFPRYHQLQVVKKLLEHSKINGAGQKYLIQHSAGSGKSNSISWTAHQLAGLFGSDGISNVFDSVLIVTDRRVLDKQLRDTVKGFEQVQGLVETITDGSFQLKTALEEGKKIIITTIQKFPVIVDQIGELAGKKFAVIIDEAHSSTSGEMVSSLNKTIKTDLGLDEDIKKDDEFDGEDLVLESLQSRKMLPNASYFAFTATPKAKTLELFGSLQNDGSFAPFHSYTMKQAIEEGFILDVLSNYTTYKSYFGLVLKEQDDTQYDTTKASKQLRRYVERHPHTLEQKAKIMISHFYHSVYLKGLVGGKAKAMLVTSSRQNAAQYHFIFKKLIRELGYSLDVITAFSGDVQLDGNSWNESSLNNFNSSKIPDEFEDGNYQVLICANKYQTGFDQPLLQTMYVDKKLGGVSAVQTLSRLNRSHKDKDSTFVLDFVNTEEDIKTAFDPYYQTTLLSEGSDPNKLNDLKDVLDGFNAYTTFQVKEYTKGVLTGVEFKYLHSILDTVVENIKKLPLEQIDDFKKKSKTYTKFYSFISQIISFELPELEELYQFLKQLSKKIIELGTAPDLLTQDVLESVDFDSYRNQKITSNTRINLEQSDPLSPPPSTSSGFKEQAKDLLENIVSNFNQQFGTDFKDEDRVRQILDSLSDDIIKEGSVQKSYQNSDTNNRKLVFQKALDEAITETVDTHLHLYNNYQDNQNFKDYLVTTLDRLVKNKLKDLV